MAWLRKGDLSLLSTFVRIVWIASKMIVRPALMFVIQSQTSLRPGQQHWQKLKKAIALVVPQVTQKMSYHLGTRYSGLEIKCHSLLLWTVLKLKNCNFYFKIESGNMAFFAVWLIAQGVWRPQTKIHDLWPRSRRSARPFVSCGRAKNRRFSLRLVLWG